MSIANDNNEVDSKNEQITKIERNENDTTPLIDKLINNSDELQKQNKIVENKKSIYVALMSFIVQFYFTGTFYSFGVFVLPIMKYFDATFKQIGVVASVSGSSALIGQIFAGYLITKYGFTKTLILSTIIGTIFTFLTGFSESIIYLIIIQAIAITTMAFTWLVSISIISQHWQKNRSKAVAIATSGSGIGISSCPQIYNSLINSYGLKHAFFIMGGVYFIISGLSIQLFRKPKQIKRRLSSNINPDGDYVKFQTFIKNKKFITFLIINLFFGFSFKISQDYLIIYATEQFNVTEQRAASIMISGGIGNFAGRSIIGLLAQKYDPFIPSAVYITGLSISLIVTPFLNSFYLLYFIAFMLCFFTGGPIAVISLSVIEILDVKSMPIGVGISLVFTGLGVAGGSQWFAQITVTEGYKAGFISVGCVCLLSSIIQLPLKKIKP